MDHSLIFQCRGITSRRYSVKTGYFNNALKMLKKLNSINVERFLMTNVDRIDIYQLSQLNLYRTFTFERPYVAAIDIFCSESFNIGIQFLTTFWFFDCYTISSRHYSRGVRVKKDSWFELYTNNQQCFVISKFRMFFCYIVLIYSFFFSFYLF